MNTSPLRTVRECLDIQRAQREPDIEVALMDFFELNEAEQKEFLLVSVMELYKQFQCLHHDINKMRGDKK